MAGRRQALMDFKTPFGVKGGIFMDDHSLVTRPPKVFASPQVLLSGTMDDAMYGSFREQLARASNDDLLAIQLTTLGGDPEVARMMGEDIRFRRRAAPSCRHLFVGKTAVYSAGVTFMSFFPVEDRFLSAQCRLLIHERLLEKTLELSGPISACIATAKAVVNEIENAITIQNEGFQDLVRGSQVSFEEVRDRAPENWYVNADQARSLGLVAQVV
jgi:hypothetical protein